MGKWSFFCNCNPLLRLVLSLEDLGIVTINEALHVPHAAVADFDGVSIEYFTQDVAFGEMHVDQLQEFLAHICLYSFTVRGG